MINLHFNDSRSEVIKTAYMREDRQIQRLADRHNDVCTAGRDCPLQILEGVVNRCIALAVKPVHRPRIVPCMYSDESRETFTEECGRPCPAEEACEECAPYWNLVISEGLWNPERGEWTAKGIWEMCK